MKNRKLNSVSTGVLIYGIKHCIDNAQNHLKAAETLKDNLPIGYATSHLVIGIEECVKGIAYILKLGDSRPIDAEIIFTQHKAKHKFIKDVLEPFSKMVTLIQMFSSESSREANAIKMYLPSSKLLLEDLPIDRLDKWFGNVERIRQRGLYVDFRNNTFNSPWDLTEEDYKDNHLILSILLSPLNLFKDLDQLGAEEIDKIFRNFKS